MRSYKFFLKIFPLITGKVEERDIVSGFRSDVIGLKSQKKTHLSYVVSGAVAKLTSTPASIVTQMITKGDIQSRGVFPPEGCQDLNLDQFKKELEKRQIFIKETHLS